MSDKIGLESRFDISSSKILKKNNRVKPKFFKLLGIIMNSHMDPIFNYLDLVDLAKIRGANKLLLALAHDYFPKRLRIEVEFIKSFQESCYDSFLNFMKIIDSQIPLSNKNWLDFDLTSVINKLKVLDKKVITALKAIKNTGKLPETVFAPICIILGYNKNSYSNIKNEGWKKLAIKIFSDQDFFRKLGNLDMDNMNEVDMLDAFVYLNLPELELENVKKYYPELEKLVLWCQSILSYHILIHPFTLRNDKSHILPGTDIHFFVTTMNKMLDRFYKFKRFLINLNIMNIPPAEYVFNLQHNREKIAESTNYCNLLTDQQIASILSYLPINQSYKYIAVNSKWRNGFKFSIDMIISEILKEIFYLKLQASEKLQKRAPILFDSNIFSIYFLMVDDILNGDSCFLSKEQLNDIKNIKIENDLIRSVTKTACIILNEKVDRKILLNGDIKYLYLEKLKTIIINGILIKQMRSINKLDININKLNSITEELNQYCSIEKLEDIKKMNRGIYQLLLWELFVYEYHKIFNPFDFISNEYISNRFDKDEIEVIKYYCEVMNYLKHNLKIKFRFSKSFEFNKLYDELKLFLDSQKMSFSLIEGSIEYIKIANVYFETKDLIPQGARPAFYERMFNEILKLTNRTSKINDSMNEVSGIYSGIPIGQLGTIKEENSLFEKNDKNNNYQKELNKMQLLTNITKPKKLINICFNDIPQDMIIKNMLFFLDINSLPKFSMVSRKTNEAVKTHIFIRLFFLNKEKKLIEHENNEIIASIEDKRKHFFSEYEIDPPSKDHACQLMNNISSEDIVELRQVFKKYNKNYENIISPLVIIMGLKAQSTIGPDGTKTISYFYPAQKLLNNKDFGKKIRDLELETIPHNRFRAVEKIIESPNYNIEKIKQLSPCIHHIISWVIGVIEFHRVIRKYSLSSYDYDILSEDEITFCTEMDNILVLYYKLLRYANTYCKKYEKFAINFMNTMNIK